MLTPVMRQYFAAKEAHPDCLMFCRIGDFYELFYEDAIVASARAATDADGAGQGEEAADVRRAVPRGGDLSAAAAAQGLSHCAVRADGRPEAVKGIVRREVTRVLTPGTAVDRGLGAGESQLAGERGCAVRARRRAWAWR